MGGVSNRVSGGILAVSGLALTAYHLYGVVELGVLGPRLLAELLPLLLSLALAAVGVELARGRLITDRFASRLLAWTGAGAAALAALGAWVFADAVARGFTLADPVSAMLGLATFGALAGALVGVYDAGRLERQRSVEQLNRITDTLRIATQELVDETERDSLEQAVCDRLIDSDPYDAVWIGRYDADDRRVRPAAWSGFDDEYVESIVVTVDDSPTGSGPGGRAIETREIQCVPDVFEDSTMEPWWDLLETHGITSLAVVPIGHGDTVYGFFSVYADRQDVFYEREREVLSELGETIGHAIASIEAHERLADRERELARQNDRLEEFAGVVSHDLRNPLNVAAGRIEYLREADDDEHLAAAADALTRMEELIEDLLALARQGATVESFEQVSLGTVAAEAWNSVDSPAATLRTDDLGVIAADRPRLRQLLENLFRNSVEHGGEGVTVTVERIEGGFAVSDDGPGIPADERDTVLRPGYSTNPDGTGFGLNIVQRIAEAHGWDVSVGESPTGGARFEFRDGEQSDR
ncbi:GAF domain-containing sensor histidine kinase [Halosimplex salinum]|uniref:GAF domain-containing sensor histidine kinase n=1 Tax=Halosimplex salinum TaxID=1710538 RepID=UPI000F467007|nr:GAF domain-containing sensor histidine kinase [Halosimplex salinum]